MEALLLPSSYILLLFFFTSVDLFSVKIDDETDHYFLYLPVVLLNIISAIYYCKLQRNVERKVREGFTVRKECGHIHSGVGRDKKNRQISTFFLKVCKMVQFAQ